MPKITKNGSLYGRPKTNQKRDRDIYIMYMKREKLNYSVADIGEQWSLSKSRIDQIVEEQKKLLAQKEGV